MRRFAVAVVLGVAVLSGSGAAAAAAPGPEGTAAKVTAAKHGASAHPARGGGAVLTWRTSREQGNVGFILYRARKATPRKRVTLLARMVAGTVLKVGRARAVKHGASYRRFDPKGQRGDRYWILDVDVSGRTRLRGPYVVRGASVRRGRNSPLLASSASAKKKPGGIGGPAVPVSPPSPVIPKGTPPDQAQALIAGRQTVRLGVDTTGWVRVGLDTLQQRGLDVTTPGNLHLFTGGREVSALVRDGGLEFYGQAVDAVDTGTRAYFVDSETGAGSQIATAPAATTAAGAPASYAATSVRDQRGVYFQTLTNGAATNFFGDVVGGSGVNVNLTAPNVASNAGARISVPLQGVSTGSHAVTVSFNGDTLGTVTWSGQTATSASFPVSGVASSGTLRLVSSSSGDVSLTGPISLAYDHAMSADGDTLAPTVPGGRRVRIGGFSQGSARVVDVTDPQQPVELDGAADGSSVSATVPGSGTHQVFAYAPDAVEAPASVDTGLPSNLAGADHDGTLTVITPAGYFNALAPLVQQRRAEGLSVTVVALQDVYDEFSFGQADHAAITRMLANARTTWRSPPQYVLLGGDGTYDPRGFEGRGTAGNVVPVALIDTDEETASDSTLTGTLATGRFPARTASEMSALVTKTLRYGAQPSTSSALLASDVDDTWNFTGSSDQLKPLLPAGWGVNQIRRADGDARSRLLAGLNAGPSIVNYAGHGSVDLWRGDLLTDADAAPLGNAPLSFYVFMTCLNGYFIDPELDALAESLVKALNGGVAVFSSTSETTPGPQEQANQALFVALFDGPTSPRLGDAIVASLSATSDPAVRDTWTLLGDPTLVIH